MNSIEQLLDSIGYSIKIDGQNQIAKKIDSRHKRYFSMRYPIVHRATQYIFNRMLISGSSRWYDAYHILYSTNVALKHLLPKLNNQDDADLLIIATLFHDVGYYAVSDKTNWSGENERALHMIEGAKHAFDWLIAEGLDITSAKKVFDAIAVHDNPYIKIEAANSDIAAKLLKADRAWVMHFISFLKDWSFSDPKKEDEKSINPIQFLAYRAKEFGTEKILIKKGYDVNNLLIDFPNLKTKAGKRYVLFGGENGVPPVVAQQTEFLLRILKYFKIAGQNNLCEVSKILKDKINKTSESLKASFRL
jgi:hypothetical protein